MPNGTSQNVDWNQVARALQLEMAVRDYEDQQKAQAMRWQGSRDYQTLVTSGVDPMEALKRTAPKLFFNDPHGLAAASKAMQVRPSPQSEIVDIGGETYIKTDGRLTHVARSRQPTDKTQTVTISTKTPTGEVIKETLGRPEYEQRMQQQKISEAQAAYDAAKAQAQERSWLSGLWNKGADTAAISAASNALRQAQMQIPKPPSSDQPKGNEIIRRDKKTGRLSVWNADTKQFIRYQD